METDRCGQPTPNEFERALLDRIAARTPELRDGVQDLHVLSREYTGVGAFTNFVCQADPDDRRWTVSLDGPVNVPSVSRGLGVTLFCRGMRPEFLELYTFGDEAWDGDWAGYELG